MLDVIERFYAIWIAGDTGNVDTILAPDYAQVPSQQEVPLCLHFSSLVAGYRW